MLQGSGCGSVGRVVASKTRGLRFESRHRQNFNLIVFTLVEKTIIKKEAGYGPFKNIYASSRLKLGSLEENGSMLTTRPTPWPLVQIFLSKLETIFRLFLFLKSGPFPASF